ncbi:MAG: GNAT family N-acetyltransferase [Bacteroidota bacterium]
MVSIIGYTHEFAADFKKLNLEWLDQYGLTEARDLEVLNDPMGTILDHGGAIYLARAGKEIVGTAALMKESEGEFELVKMSVTKAWQGKGISKLLIEACLEKARELGAKKIILFSSSLLPAALSLYAKYGFKHVPLTNNPFATADVKMELRIYE